MPNDADQGHRADVGDEVASSTPPEVGAGAEPEPARDRQPCARSREVLRDVNACDPTLDRTYWVPFGRYRPARESAPPNNATMVGREGQRLYFLDLLLSLGSRGAFLITGHRGAGKTSFVAHTLGEYQEQVFERFLLSGVGKALLWDRIALTLLVVGFLALGLGLAQVSELAVAFLASRPLLCLLVVVPITTLTLYPILWARDTLHAVLLGRLSRYAHLSGTLAWASTLILCSLAWNAPGLGHPDTAIAPILASVALVYCCIEARDVAYLYLERRIRRITTREHHGMNCLGILVLVWWLVFRPYPLQLTFSQLVTVVTLLAGCGLFLGARQPPGPATQRRVAALIVVVFGSIAALGAFAPSLPLVLFLALLVIGLVVLTACRSLLPQGGRSGHPLWGPALKVVASVAVALHLSQPGVSFGLHKLRQLTGPSSSSPSADSLAAVGLPLGTPGPLVRLETVDVLSWLALAAALALFLYHIDFDWLVRPLRGARAEGGLSVDTAARVEWMRAVTRTTLPWMLYRGWLPVLVVPVNLGFEEIEYKQVIRSMLEGLRERYQRVFVGWTSTVAVLGRVLLVVLTLGTANAVNRQLSQLPTIEPAGWGPLSTAAMWLDAPLIDQPLVLPEAGRVRRSPYRYLLPIEHTAGTESIRVRPRLLLLLLGFYALGLVVVRRSPLVSYRQVLDRLDLAIDALSAHVDETRATVVSAGPGRPSFASQQHSRRIRRDPQDPGFVEGVLLGVLRDMQDTRMYAPGSRFQSLTLPAPEIVFVFDELDKLAERADPRDDRGPNELAPQGQPRSVSLYRLLAQMKNLRSEAPARFVFIAGRNLHDEWLADKVSRNPLLTSFFQAEIYIPSLLTDANAASADGPGRVEALVEAFVESQYRRAEANLEVEGLQAQLPSFMTSMAQTAADAYPHVQEGSWGRSSPVARPSMPLGYFRSSEAREEVPHRAFVADPGAQLFSDFYRFLALRSHGHPKRLHEALAAFIRPTSRVFLEVERGGTPASEHLLLFPPLDRFRVQLGSSLLGQARRVFPHLQDRDDKLVHSVIFLLDFLMKFHGRAFSWENLERLDDLVDVHRAPDLRAVIAQLIDATTGDLLHPILNGMYDYRFRSQMAREIEFISRSSGDDMAAFNFTLDESQELRSVYRNRLRRLGPNASPAERRHLHAALGELCEFDREFENARVHYEQALAALDEQKLAPESFGTVVQATGDSSDFVRGNLGWAVGRLRIMLQIGMTFEASRNYESALLQYRDARSLAECLIDACKAWPASQRHGRLESLKQVSLLFQPMFAEAWVAEKLQGTVDVSTTVVEGRLAALRRDLPLSVDRTIAAASGPASGGNSQFALIFAELHKKAGDLYFYKGRGRLRRPTVDWEDRTPLCDLHAREEGHALWAYQHYCVALHELRRLATYRRESSAAKLNPWRGRQGTPWETLLPGAWPDSIFRSVASTLGDLSDALLARVSLRGLAGRAGEWKSLTDTSRAVLAWLDASGDAGGTPDLNSWLGTWCPPGAASGVTVEFEVGDIPHTDSDRLQHALAFSHAAAQALHRGGYAAASGREHLRALETIGEYLTWCAILRACQKQLSGHGPSEGLDGLEPLVDNLMVAGTECLTILSTLDQSKERELRIDSAASFDRPLRVSTLWLLMCGATLNRRCWPEAEAELEKQVAGRNGGSLSQKVFNFFGETVFPQAPRLRYWRSIIEAQALNLIAVAGPESATVASERSALARRARRIETEVKRYGAPLQIPHMARGTTLALAALAQGNQSEETAWLKSEALRQLARSQQVVTQRREHYRVIQDLYYLYDDFNDRRTHYSHALQMAGLELTSSLKRAVRDS